MTKGNVKYVQYMLNKPQSFVLVKPWSHLNEHRTASLATTRNMSNVS